MRAFLLLPACLAVLAPLFACQIPPEVTRGQALYAVHCAECHGPRGEGAGPASLGLGGPPPDLRGLAQRNGGIFPARSVWQVIDGAAREGHPTAAMPEFGRQEFGPDVKVPLEGVETTLPADMLALIRHLESLQE